MRSLSFILGIICCLAAQGVFAQPVASVSDTDIVWPRPPEQPRIRYLGELASQHSLGEVKPSFFERVKRLVLGAAPEQQVTVQRPFDLHVNARGRIYVSSGMAGSLSVFDPVTKEARVITPTGAGVLAKPMGLGGDNEGHLYVADPAQRRIVVFDSTEKFVQAYGGRNILLNPVDVAASPSGDRIYVADSYLHQLVIFDRSGTLLRRVGRDEGDLEAKEARRLTTTHGDGGTAASNASSDLIENRDNAPASFRYPAFLDVGPDGTVYVSDGMNFRVQAFDADGNFRFVFGRLGDTPGSFARPKGIAVDQEGHVYVVDAAFNNVQVFSAEGQLLLAFGGLGSGPGQLWLPLGLSTDQQGRILVADRYNNRLQIYQYLSPSNPQPKPPAGTAETLND